MRKVKEAGRVALDLSLPFMFGLPLAQLGALSYRILAGSISAWAFHRPLKQSYGWLARGDPDSLLADTTHKAEQNARTRR